MDGCGWFWNERGMGMWMTCLYLIFDGFLSYVTWNTAFINIIYYFIFQMHGQIESILRYTTSHMHEKNMEVS